MKSSQAHWDGIFSETEDPELGWYEADATATLELLHTVPGWDRSTVFLPGAGTSVLIEELLSSGAKLVLNDISREALDKVKERLKDDQAEIVWLCQDIARPVERSLPAVDIWIDRAVLHFLTDRDDIRGYCENVRTLLKPGGYAIFAEFSETGAPKCAGLTLQRYSVESLSETLGTSFELLSHFDHTYINPEGDPRPYIYALYRRTPISGWTESR